MNEDKKTEIRPDSQRLQSDINQVQQQLSLLPELALDVAIRKGIEKGRKRSIRLSRKRWSLSMMSALTAIILLTAFVRVSPAFASIVKDIPGFSGFVELIEGDRTLISAVENEFFQPVKQSVEKNGYKFTVDSIIADAQRMVILYKVEGPNINGNTGFLDFKLKTSEGLDLEAVIKSVHTPNDDAEGLSVPVYDSLDILMGEGNKMPESLQFSLKLGEEWLTIEFPIDHKHFAGMREDISIQNEFEVSGQRFTIKDAILTPLQVSVTIEADPNNTKHANEFVNLALIDEKGRRYETNSAFGDLNTSITRHFQGSYFVKPKELTLVADGLHLSDNDLTLTVDTEKLQIISSPGNKINLASSELVNGEYEIALELLELDETDKKSSYTLLKHGGSFKDAAGTSYPVLDYRASRWNSSNNTVTQVYRIPKADYKQPLTFEIEQFPGYVLQPINISIK